MGVIGTPPIPAGHSGICAHCLGMQHSGIGGGGFMLIRDSNGEYESIGMVFLAVLKE